MEKFNIEEMNLMCIYNTGSRTGLIKSLKDMRQYLESDERELLGLTDQVLEKLDIMTDTEFEQLELYPEFYESNELS